MATFKLSPIPRIPSPGARDFEAQIGNVLSHMPTLAAEIKDIAEATVEAAVLVDAEGNATIAATGASQAALSATSAVNASNSAAASLAAIKAESTKATKAKVAAELAASQAGINALAASDNAVRAEAAVLAAEAIAATKAEEVATQAAADAATQAVSGVIAQAQASADAAATSAADADTAKNAAQTAATTAGQSVAAIATHAQTAQTASTAASNHAHNAGLRAAESLASAQQATSAGQAATAGAAQVLEILDNLNIGPVVSVNGKFGAVNLVPSDVGAAPESHTHPASIITQDANRRFVTDAEKAAWNGKEAGGTAATAMTAHTSAADPHDQYLPKAGGTMSGPISFAPAQTWPIFNQSTTGNAGTATKLVTARTINGVLFDGSANITINAVDSTAREQAITAGTTAQYWRGDKTWRDLFTDVRAATLTGLSTATNAVVSATDTVLVALGKLQKQVSDNLATLTSHTGNTSNPHSVTKAQVGLGNVDNTSDASKPISTAAQTALNAKQNTLVSGINIKTLNGESLLGAGNLELQLAADQPSAVTYTYDASGRVETTTETLPTGTRTTTVTYNEAGQVKTVTVTLGTSTRTTQYAYDQYGVLTGTTSTES